MSSVQGLQYLMQATKSWAGPGNRLLFVDSMCSSLGTRL